MFWLKQYPITTKVHFYRLHYHHFIHFLLGISNPEGFAIDWMSGNMYFSSFANGGNKASISVAQLNGAYRAEVISNGLTKPNSLVVFPSEG